MKQIKIVLAIVACFIYTSSFAQKTEFIIDADTGNEMDDLYAIVRAFDDNEVILQGLISAHFNNPQLVTDSMWNSYSTENINTLQLSQMENERLLRECNMQRIPHPPGCEKMVGYSWGYYEGAQIPQSEGVDFIIEMAKKYSPEKKLNVVCLGAVTNVAAAILTAPSIAKNIRLYALTMKYDLEKKVWNKNSFNARNDLNALDIVLNQTELELFIIPGQVSQKLTFDRADTQKRLARYKNEVSKNLSDRWDKVNAGNSWIMWDLALIEAILHPEFATLEKGLTPPENIQREINIYSKIDANAMRKDFWKAYKKLMKRMN
ncbi:nucleoside hydrolase [uncultured Draconibacterium sp.]|uniref:nucleoside hydrolase n=1 Tax=uncultured Draconibacterium sp. TaxID=1573823 RepID=UPI0029C6D6BF|nr:nucleoside hydrolase [uncultured Draconibacterium sp.]